MNEKITLADLKAKQQEHRAHLKAYYAKKAEVESLKKQYQQADMELDALTMQARIAVHELRTMGANFALQIEDDFTPVIPGTEQPGDVWTPEGEPHPEAFNPDPDYGIFSPENGIAYSGSVELTPKWDYKHN